MFKYKKCIFFVLFIILLFLAVWTFSFAYEIFNDFNEQAAATQVEDQLPPPPIEEEQPEPEPEELSVKTGIVSDSDLENENADATIPPIWGDYRSIGFVAYVRAMQSRGCITFFFSKTDNMWKSIDFFTGKIEKFSVSDVGKKWGSKPSSITKEPMLAKYLKGEVPNTDVFLAKPISMENLINETIRKKLTNNNIKISDITGIKADYTMQGSHLYIKVQSLIDKNLGARKFDALIEL